MAGHHLRLLGEATLEVEGRSPVRLERKVAGVLAYLALEGPTPRSQLAGLLWPEVEERTARNNLVQALRRLRRAAGGYEAASGDRVLKLAEDLEVDVAQQVLFSFQGRYAEVLGQEGELLQGHDYDDCPDFAEWLLAEREHLLGLWREALAQEAERLEGQGELRRALAAAERLFQADPISEVGCRRVMRLYYRLGDRGAALSAYHRLEDTLHREMGLKPLPETQALAREIAAGTRVFLPPVQPRPEVPLALLHPPLLVGREREWAALEEAWEAGQAVFIAGEAGVGKSRLMRDFLAHKGAYAWFSARPGDKGTPFAFHAQAWREALERYPDLALPLWARQELARILPDLFPEVPPSWKGPRDKLRLFEAMAELVRGLGKHVEGLAVDDLQHVDPAGLEAGAYLVSRFMPAPPGVPRGLYAYRKGELSPRAEAGVERLVRAGLAVRLDLEPLPPKEVEALLSSLALPGFEPARLAPSLARHTGGNPFFILETLRLLWGSGGPREGGVHPLPVPRRVKELIAQRAEHLSSLALRLAQTAAVAGESFSLELAARVLGTEPLDLAAPWAELQAAQMLREGRLAHDLLQESMLEGIPAPIQVHLHRQVALSLEQVQAHPARIAQHWLEAQEAERAAQWWLVASRRYQERSLHAEALAMLDEALAHAQEETTRAEAQLLKADIYREERRYDEAESLLEALLQRALPLRSRIEALRTRAYLAIGDHPRAAGYAQEAYVLAQKLGDAEILHLTVTAYAATLWGLGRSAEAVELLEPELARDPPDPRWRIRLLAYLGAMYAHQGRFAEAYPLLEEAYALAQTQDPYWQVLTAAFLVGADVERGEPLAHRTQAEGARALGPFDVSEYLALVLARAYLEAREPETAFELLAERPGQYLGPAYACLGLAYRSQTLLALGQEGAAREAFREALALAERLEGAPRALAQLAVAGSRLGAGVQGLLERIAPGTLGLADQRSLQEAGLAFGPPGLGPP